MILFAFVLGYACAEVSAAPATPTNTSPGSTSSPGPTTASSSVTLSWRASTGATYYGLGVRDLATNVLVVDTNVSGTSLTVNLSAGKQYRWNVNACNSAGCSSYTTPLYFQTPSAVSIPATPTGPSPGSTSSPGPTTSGSSVTLRWNGSSGATYYGLGVRDLATNVLVVDTNVSGTSFTANLSAGKQYRWNVNACNGAGCSSYTTPLYFQTPSAVSIPATPGNTSPGSTSSPGPTTASSSVTLSWSSSSGATSYGLGVRDIAANVLVVDTNVSGTSYVANLTAGKQYRWNVNACNSAGCSSYSTLLYFQTPGAVTVPSMPSSPSPGSTSSPGPTTSGTSVVLSWGASGGATYYGLGVRDMATNVLIVDTNVSGTSFTANLSAGKQYRWNVNACNTAGCSSYTPPLYFQTPGTTSVPATPANLSPGSATGPGPTLAGTSVTLSWNASGGATYYGLGVRDMATNTLVVDTNVANTSLTVNLSAGRHYRWNVNACSGAGCSAFAAPLYFQTPASATIGAPTLSAPSNGSTAVSTTPTFNWSGVSGANRYWLLVASSPSTLPTDPFATTCPACVISGNTNATSYTAPNGFPYGYHTATLSAGTTYYWKVQAWNSGGTQGGYSPVYSFTTAGATTNPSIGVLPSSGTLGTTFRFTGSGFTHNNTVTLNVTRPDGSSGGGGKYSADSSGNVTFVITSKTTDPTGQWGFRLTDDSSGKQTSTNAQYTSAPQSGTDAMSFSASTVDVTIPDNDQRGAGTTFTKTWRFKNSGTTTWSGYTAVFVANPGNGNPSINLNAGGTSASVPLTSPGQTVDFSIPMRAPSNPGTYYSYWQLRNANGVTFGTQFYVKIRVAPPQRTTLGFGTETGRGGTNDSPPSNAGRNADPVNTATGNYNYAAADLRVPGRGLDVEFARSYNSQDASAGPLGNGWSHSFNIFLTNITPTGLSVHYSDGKVLDYVQQPGTANFTSSYPGYYDTLIQNGDGSWTLGKTDQRAYVFDSAGKLTAIRDRNSNQITLTYSGSNLSQVTDTVGRTFGFTYSGSRLTAVTDPAGRTLQFGYDAAANLTSFRDARGNLNTYSYDASNRLTRIVDGRQNNLLVNTYDGSNRVATQANGRGNLWTFVYNADGSTTVSDPLNNPTKYLHDTNFNMERTVDRNANNQNVLYDERNNRAHVSDANSNYSSYVYDGSGNITTRTDANLKSRHAVYDSQNNPTKVVDEVGNQTQLSYDGRGNLTALTNALGNSSSTSYNEFGQPLVSTDAQGGVTLYGYDAQGNLTSVKDAQNNVTNYGYDAIGRRVSVTDARGHTTRYAYDENDNLLTVTDPLGNVTAYTYDANNNRTSVRDARGHTTTYAYDENNLLVKETDAKGGYVQHTYDSLDRRVGTRDKRGNLITFTYDNEGRPLTVTDPLGNKTTYAYDANGNRTHVTDAGNQTTLFTYDALNRVTKIQDPLGNSVQREYDAAGRLSKETDPRGNSTAFTYDEVGNLTQVTDAAAGTARFAYDRNRNRISQTDPNNRTSSLGYDKLNRLLSSKDPLDNTYAYTYDEAGNRTTQIDAKGQTIRYAYDEGSRLTSITYPNSSTVRLTYDANGNVTQMVDALGTTTSVYDELNRLTAYTDPFGKTVGYQYDAAGNITALTYPDGKQVTYQYDAGNRLTALTDWAGKTTSYTYGSTNLLTKVTYPNGITTTLTYDEAGRLTARSDSGVSSYSYTLDKAGNRTAASVTQPLTARPPTAAQGYAYDAANRIQSAGAATFAFDANGNMTGRTEAGVTTPFGYDFENRLVAVGGTSQYAYNGQGVRLQKAEGAKTTRYVVDTNHELSQVLCETDANGAISAYYVHGAGLAYKVGPDGAHYYYHFDPTGSTVAMTDDAKNVVNRYAYGPFGEVTRVEEKTSNPFQFVGQYGAMNDNNGLYFFRARYYAPASGRFLTRDKGGEKAHDPQSLNKYIYGANNPVRYIDPSGFDWIDSALNWTTSLARNATKEAVQQALLLAIRGQINRHGFDIFGEGLFQVSLRVPLIGSVVSLTIDAREILNNRNMDWTEKAARISLKIANEAIVAIFRNPLTGVAAGTIADATFEWQFRQIKKIGEPAGELIYSTFFDKSSTEMAPINPVGRPTKNR